MSLFCKGCHTVIDKDTTVCPHDMFTLVEANLEFPPSMTIGDISLNFESFMIKIVSSHNNVFPVPEYEVFCLL